MKHKKEAGRDQMGLDPMYELEPHDVELELRGEAERDEGSEGLDEIPVKSGRELVEVKRQGTRCYRLEKTRCGKKSCRCTRGELHGPYWYVYYRENARVRCEYIGKSLLEDASLENRARKAWKRSQSLRERAAKTVAEVKETLRNLVPSGDTPKLSG